MSEYIADTALIAAVNAGKFTKTLGNGDLPPGFPITLNTYFFQRTFPHFNLVIFTFNTLFYL